MDFRFTASLMVAAREYFMKTSNGTKVLRRVYQSLSIMEPVSVANAGFEQFGVIPGVGFSLRTGQALASLPKNSEVTMQYLQILRIEEQAIPPFAAGFLKYSGTGQALNGCRRCWKTELRFAGSVLN